MIKIEKFEEIKTIGAHMSNEVERRLVGVTNEIEFKKIEEKINELIKIVENHINKKKHGK